MRLDSCIGAVSVASQVLFEAEGDGKSGLTDAWTTLDLVKAEVLPDACAKLNSTPRGIIDCQAAWINGR